MIINSGESDQSIWSITEKTIEVLLILNHDEADTRLSFHERISNKAIVIVAKDADAFLLLIYVLEQLECFLLPWCMAIDSNHFIKIKMIFDNLVSEICYVFPELHATTSCNTTSYKFNVEKVHIFKKRLLKRLKILKNVWIKF